MPGISPCLLNLWTFDDPDAKGCVVGGIAGPSDRPDRDWRLFADAMETIKGRDAAGYGSLLDVLDGIVRAYVLSGFDDLVETLSDLTVAEVTDAVRALRWTGSARPLRDEPSSSAAG